MDWRTGRARLLANDAKPAFLQPSLVTGATLKDHQFNTMVSRPGGFAEEQRLLESCRYVGPGHNHGRSRQPQTSVSGEKGSRPALFDNTGSW